MDAPAHPSSHRGPPKNLGLLRLIRAKREWHWKPSPEQLRRGFRGWHQRGFLPHFDAPNVTQMVTFMLANLVLSRTGPFWQQDYFDTRIRDEDHLRKAIHYTEYNPAKAAHVKDPRDWKWGSARLRDERGRLPWQARPQVAPERRGVPERGVYAASTADGAGGKGEPEAGGHCHGEAA